MKSPCPQEIEVILSKLKSNFKSTITYGSGYISARIDEAFNDINFLLNNYINLKPYSKAKEKGIAEGRRLCLEEVQIKLDEELARIQRGYEEKAWEQLGSPLTDEITYLKSKIAELSKLDNHSSQVYPEKKERQPSKDLSIGDEGCKCQSNPANSLRGKKLEGKK